MRRTLTVLALAAAALSVALPALAHGGAIDEAVEGLRDTPVYVERGAAPSLTDAEVEDLLQQIRSAGRTIYVAVIDHQDDPAHDVVHEVVGGLGRDGTYVVVAGGDVGVHSTEFDHAVSERLQEEANARPNEDLPAKLSTLVFEVASTPAAAAENESSTPWAWIAVGLVAIAVVAGVTTFWTLRRVRPGTPGAPPAS